MRVLVTGFGPFHGVVENPTQLLAEWAPQLTTATRQVFGHVLSVSFDGGAAAVSSLLEQGYDAAIMTGIKSGTDTLHIERCAHWVGNHKFNDVDGKVPSAASSATAGPLVTAIDVEAVASRLTALGIQAAISDHAGTYVCNHVYWAGLETIQRLALPTRCVFLHMPPHESATGVPVDNRPHMRMVTQRQALAAVLDYVAPGPEA